ncbi:hypothetical protein LSAT2_017067 [Lamellibrachia satsuma]|nr:hypothetical protein LSAT2_017067 [Lamellibrachia satsuma]
MDVTALRSPPRGDISRIASVRSRETKNIADEVKLQRYGQSASSADSVFGVLARTDGAGGECVQAAAKNSTIYPKNSSQQL